MKIDRFRAPVVIFLSFKAQLTHQSARRPSLREGHCRWRGYLMRGFLENVWRKGELWAFIQEILIKALMWWGFFATGYGTYLIESTKNMEERKRLSDQEHQFGAGQKKLGHENEYPHFDWGKAEGILICGDFCDYQKWTPFSMEKELYFYLPGQLLWMKIMKVFAIAWSPNHNRLDWFR